jgi:diguanylate cyclase (GGDEF)-like protein/PAS domain S-box-containing protein
MNTRLRPFLQPVTYLGVGMLICIYAAVAYFRFDDRHAAERNAVRDNENIVALLKLTVRQTLRRVDNDVRLIRTLYLRDPNHFDFSLWANALKDRGGEDQRYAIIGPDGVAHFASSGLSEGERYFGDKKLFQVQLTDGQDDVYVSEPMSFSWSPDKQLVLTRRIVGKDGSFEGVVAGTIDVDALNKAYKDLALGSDSFASLWGPDGTIRVAGANGVLRADLVGQNLPNAGLYQHLKQSARGTYWNTPGDSPSLRKINGVKRLVSYDVIDGFPLIAVVGRTETEIFKDARSSQVSAWLVASVLTMGILAAIVFGARRQRWLHETALRLKQTNARFELALENMPQGLCMFDADRRLVISNRRYATMYGLLPDAVRPGMQLKEIIKLRTATASPEAAAEYAENQLQLSASHVASETETLLPDGRSFLVSHQPMPDGGSLGVHQDVTEQRQSAARIRELAYRDGLTGTASRLAFLDLLREACKRLQTDRKAFAVHIVDLDNFKDINDSLGHPIGDALLAQIAQRLRLAAGEKVAVGRLGGDEFALLQFLASPEGHEDIALAQRILDTIRTAYDIDDHELFVEASIGIAKAPAHGSDGDLLIKRADLALYTVKAAGRNSYRVFEASMERAAARRHDLTSEIRRGIAREEFELEYQSIVTLPSRAVVSLEALLRWRHPQRGRVMPDAFIDAAEHSGLIRPLGRWVLHRACHDALQWPASVKVAINLSPVQFRDNLVGVVSDVLAESGLPASRLELEVTETVLLEQTAEIIRCLEELRALGVSVVLDDFGSGYASIGYLRRFKFDRLKIDRSLVHGLARQPDAPGLIVAITGMARALDIRTTAEGIETEDDLTLLRAAGCDEGQGFLLGRPLPAAQLLASLESSPVAHG